MSMETELKLRITPENLARLRRHALFRSHQISPPVTRHLYNVYYDTPTLQLHQSHMALRLRRAGRQWLQTLKGGGSIKGGMHQRHEWELPVPSGELDFSGLDEAIWEEYLPSAWRNTLKPVFNTDFHRTSRLLEWQGAQIEVCMDHGEVKTAQHSTAICEVELELKSGEPQQLFELALTMLDIVPFELETVSKAEQGFRLLSGYTEKPVKTVLPKFSERDSLRDVMQALIWSCLLNLQSNLHGAMTSDDAEYLHQMRVALRRLRVVLRMAEKDRADDRLAALRGELADLGSALGRIREWDVFIAEVAEPLCALHAGEAGLAALLAVSRQRRADSYALLRGAAMAQGLQSLMLRLSIWMNGAYWRQAGAPRVCAFAQRHLHGLEKNYRNRVKRLDCADFGQLHALRIQAKKLRYSAECYGGLYDNRTVNAYLSALAPVQEVLGNINDVAAAQRLLEDIASCLPAGPQAVEVTKEYLGENSASNKKKLLKAIRRFSKIKAFWEK